MRIFSLLNCHGWLLFTPSLDFNGASHRGCPWPHQWALLIGTDAQGPQVWQCPWFPCDFHMSFFTFASCKECGQGTPQSVRLSFFPPKSPCPWTVFRLYVLYYCNFFDRQSSQECLPGGTIGYPAEPGLICLSVCLSVCLSICLSGTFYICGAVSQMSNYFYTIPMLRIIEVVSTLLATCSQPPPLNCYCM